MQISQEDFERAIEVVYKRGVVRPSKLFIPDKEVRETINDVYNFLKYDISASNKPLKSEK